MAALTAAFNQEKFRIDQNTCYFKIYFQLNIRKDTSPLVNRNTDQWCKEYICVPITRSQVTQFIALQETRLLFYHHAFTEYFIQLASLKCSCRRSWVSHTLQIIKSSQSRTFKTCTTIILLLTTLFYSPERVYRSIHVSNHT